MTAHVTTILDLKTARIFASLRARPDNAHITDKGLREIAYRIALEALPAYKKAVQDGKQYFTVK